MRDPLTYQNLVDELLRRVPMFANRRKEDESFVSLDDTSAHLVFGDFSRFLLERLRTRGEQKDDDVILRNSFEFLDEMLTSEDPNVVNLAQVGVFESFADNPYVLATAKLYLTEEARSVLEYWLGKWSAWLRQN